MPSGMTLQTASLNGGSPYTLKPQPSIAERIRAAKDTADMPTLESMGHIDWGIKPTSDGLIGVVRELHWPWMNDTDFGRIQDYYELAADTLIVWDAGSTKHGSFTYNVRMLSFTSKDEPQAVGYKRGVILKLLITGVN